MFIYVILVAPEPLLKYWRHNFNVDIPLFNPLKYRVYVNNNRKHTTHLHHEDQNFNVV